MNKEQCGMKKRIAVKSQLKFNARANMGVEGPALIHVVSPTNIESPHKSLALILRLLPNSIAYGILAISFKGEKEGRSCVWGHKAMDLGD